MSDFELGISRAVHIYTAGLRGATVPYFTGMRTSDVEELYTAGYLAALDEIDQSLEETWAKKSADWATNMAARAAKR